MSRMVVGWLLALCAVACANQVHRFSVHSASQKGIMDRFVQQHSGSEVWDEVPGSHMDVLLQEAHLEDAASIPLYRSTFIGDVASLIEVSESEQLAADPSDFHAKYHSSAELTSFLESLAAKHEHAKIVHLGESVMGNKMVGLQIGDASKPEIVVNGGQHAREWIAPAAVAYAADQLLQNDAAGVLNTHSVMMIATANPDGYDYSAKKDNRMWRKNMEDYSKTRFEELMETSSLRDEDSCFGTDMNRNWVTGTKFVQAVQGEEVSSSECAATYEGAKPMSEKEVKNIATYITDKKGAKPGIAAFVDVHSYSQKVIPAGCNNQAMSEVQKQAHLAVTQSVATAMTQVHGASYTTGSCPTVMYACSGVAHDWAHFDGGVPTSIAIELRDQGSQGFLIPPSKIVATGQELHAGINALAKAVHEPTMLVDAAWAEGTL